MDGQNYLSLRKAAKKLGMTKQNLYSRVRKGRFPIARLINGRWKVLERDLYQWIQNSDNKKQVWLKYRDEWADRSRVIFGGQEDKYIFGDLDYEQGDLRN